MRNKITPLCGQLRETDLRRPPKDSGMTNDGNSYRTQLPEPDWHKIAEKASEEQDPKKLAQLIQALRDRLEELQRSRKQASR